MSDVPEIPKEIEELADELSGGWWNYRIVEKSNSWIGPDGNRHLEKYYELHEVYYNGKGEIWSWTENPVGIYFESYEEGSLYKEKHGKKSWKIKEEEVIL